MAKPDPYSRIYWRLSDEFPAIYDDDAALAAWVRLLVIAEGAWPGAAQMPRKIKRSALKTLVDCELISMLPGDRFRVRGLDAERNRRAEAARPGGIASGRSRSAGTSVQRTFNRRSTNVELDETRREKTRRAYELLESGQFATFAQALEATKDD